MKLLIALFPFLFSDTGPEPVPQVVPVEAEAEAVLVPDGYEGPLVAIPAPGPVF